MTAAARCDPDKGRRETWSVPMPRIVPLALASTGICLQKNMSSTVRGLIYNLQTMAARDLYKDGLGYSDWQVSPGSSLAGTDGQWSLRVLHRNKWTEEIPIRRLTATTTLTTEHTVHRVPLRSLANVSHCRQSALHLVEILQLSTCQVLVDDTPVRKSKIWRPCNFLSTLRGMYRVQR